MPEIEDAFNTLGDDFPEGISSLDLTNLSPTAKDLRNHERKAPAVSDTHDAGFPQNNSETV